MSWRNETCGNWSCNNFKSNKKSGFCKNHYGVYKDLIYSGMDHNEASMCTQSDDSHNDPYRCRLSKWSEDEAIKGWAPRDYCNHKMGRGLGLCNKHLLMCSRHCHDSNTNILEFIDTKESEVNKSVCEAENAHAEKLSKMMAERKREADRKTTGRREEERKREADRKTTERREDERKREADRKTTERREEERKREEARNRNTSTSHHTSDTSSNRSNSRPENGNYASNTNNTSEYYNDPDGIRVSGGPRVDPEITQKQEERVRELRRAQMKKECDAREMADVQKRVDQEVDLWAQSKDLLTMLRTFNHILPGFPVIQIDGSVKKAYMNALRLVHPDKIDQGAGVETKAKAQRVFTKLREHKP